jgi:protein-S-isoprenylcysteine O-methyltransferase Ste14
VSFFLKFRPPRIAAIFVIVAGICTWVTPAGNGIMFPAPWPGVLVAAIGFATMMAGCGLFKRRNVAICPNAPTARLVTDGIYRFSRNPMYLGMITMLTGLAITIGSWPFYVCVGAYFSVINFAFCPFEEAKLTNIFGGEYKEYARSVRRWI